MKTFRLVYFSFVCGLLGLWGYGAPVVLENASVRVTFDEGTGALVSMCSAGGSEWVSEGRYLPFDLCQGEKEGSANRYVGWDSYRFVGMKKTGERTVEVSYTARDWGVVLRYELDAALALLTRSAVLTWNGREEVKIKAFWWRFPTFRISEEADAGEAYVFFPGSFGGEKQDVKSRRKVRCSGWQCPGIFQRNAVGTALFVVNYLTPESDNGGTEFVRTDDGLQVTQMFSIAGRVPPGKVMKLGSSLLWLVLDADGEQVLKNNVHALYAKIGMVVPKDRAPAFETSNLYCFHPGGTIGSNCKDLGGFTAAQKLAERVTELNMNAVWSMPIEDVSIYCPRDYYKFQEGLGTGDEYRALVKKFHDAGIYVMQDSVPHGGKNHFERAVKHPEWLTYEQDGSTYDYWCFDFNWPTWQDYMNGVAKFYMTEYGVDGYRVDACSGSKCDNWNPAIPYNRASFSRSQGGLNMQRAIRSGVKSVKPETGGILAEVNGDIYGSVSDAIYDFTGAHLYHRLRHMTPEEWTPKFRRWLYEKQYAGIAGLIRMRYLESHDTLRSQPFYGIQQARALMAMVAFIDGMPMVYQEQDVGNADAYAQIFHIRNQLPELQNGTSDYLSLDVPDGVFAAIRFRGENRSVVLVNLKSEETTFPLALPGVAQVTDMMAEQKKMVEKGKLTVHLPAYGYTVLALRELEEIPFRPQETRMTRRVDPTEISDRDVVLEGKNWRAVIDRKTGMLRAYARNGALVLEGVSVKLPDAFHDLQPRVSTLSDSKDGKTTGVAVTWKENVIRLIYTAQDEGLALRFQGDTESAALLLPCVNADIWQADGMEGTLRDRLFYRNDAIDKNSRHGIYWRTLETETMFDSWCWPLKSTGLTAVGPEPLAIRFFQIPGRARWLNRCGENKTLTAELTGACDVLLAGPNVPLEKPLQTAAGRALVSVVGGWQFENDFYKIRLSRTGALESLESKANGPIYHSGNLYTDHGFAAAGERYSNDNEVEVRVAIRGENGGIRLHFEGRPRRFDRFGKMHCPVDYALDYVLDDSAKIGMTMKTSAAKFQNPDNVFLSWMMTSETVDSYAIFQDGNNFASGKIGEKAGRLWQSKEQGFPEAVALQIAGQTVLVVDGWQGNLPDNVFQDGRNFFIAVFDGKSNGRNDFQAQWNFTVNERPHSSDKNH
ncbi:MAG: alpha-amylase family glycosyl hydrolase [Planctomycetia bacterium]|nr:alpha-amylase family glycosyl hydrolase [Planctomycetia bacterium]